MKYRVKYIDNKYYLQEKRLLSWKPIGRFTTPDHVLRRAWELVNKNNKIPNFIII